MERARPASAADVGRIEELAQVARAELIALRGGATWAAREARDGGYADLLTNPDAVVVVGTIDDVVVGFGTAERETVRDGSRLGVIRELFVEPEARAVGVGEAMMNLFLETLVTMGCAGVDAFALPGHREAKNFFEETGLTARLLVMHREL